MCVGRLNFYFLRFWRSLYASISFEKKNNFTQRERENNCGETALDWNARLLATSARQFFGNMTNFTRLFVRNTIDNPIRMEIPPDRKFYTCIFFPQKTKLFFGCSTPCYYYFLSLLGNTRYRVSTAVIRIRITSNPRNILNPTGLNRARHCRRIV